MFVCQAFGKCCIEICWLRAMEYLDRKFFFLFILSSLTLDYWDWITIEYQELFHLINCRATEARSSLVWLLHLLHGCFGFCVAIDTVATNERREKMYGNETKEKTKWKSKMIRKQVAIIYYWQQLLHQIPPIYIINYESCMKLLLLLFKRKTQTETHAMRHIIYIRALLPDQNE